MTIDLMKMCTKVFYKSIDSPPKYIYIYPKSIYTFSTISAIVCIEMEVLQKPNEEEIYLALTLHIHLHEKPNIHNNYGDHQQVTHWASYHMMTRLL